MQEQNLPVTEEGRKTKQLIYKSAIKLLKEVGYEKLTIRKICQEANTSNGSFYHFFKNKDELLAYYYTETAEQFLNIEKEKIDVLNLDNQMLAYYQWFIKCTSEFGVDFCANFFNARNRAMDTNQVYNAVYEISKEYLQKATDKILGDNTPDEIARELCVLAKGIIFDWSSHDGDYNIEEFSKKIYENYLKGVLKND